VLEIYAQVGHGHSQLRKVGCPDTFLSFATMLFKVPLIPRNWVIEAESQPVFFFADESWIEIEGKKHLVLGALGTSRPGPMANAVAQLKKDLGLEPFDEIKWNSNRYAEPLRHSIGNGILRLIPGSVGVITIVEGQDKQKAAELLASQIGDCCEYYHIPSYIVNFDHGLINSQREFADFLIRRKHPPCLGLQVLDSSFDQLIQCTNIFVGFYRTAMKQALGEKVIYIPNTDESFADIRIGWSFLEHVHLWTRGVLWGNEDEFMQAKDECRRSFGTGFRVHSSISAETKKLLEERIATPYMGCLH
jgi:hypothetical protein